MCSLVRKNAACLVPGKEFTMFLCSGLQHGSCLKPQLSSIVTNDLSYV